MCDSTCDTKCASALLDAVARDIVALRALSSSSAIVSDEIFGFHVQQAAEKLMRAWLALLGETYPLTHNIAILMELLEARYGSTSETALIPDLVEFTPFAVRHRYEALESDMIPLNREDAIEKVLLLNQAVKAIAN